MHVWGCSYACSQMYLKHLWFLSWQGSWWLSPPRGTAPRCCRHRYEQTTAHNWTCTYTIQSILKPPPTVEPTHTQYNLYANHHPQLNLHTHNTIYMQTTTPQLNLHTHNTIYMQITTHNWTYTHTIQSIWRVESSQWISLIELSNFITWLAENGSKRWQQCAHACTCMCM